MRMPMFTWTTFVTSSLILFAFPPLTVGLGLLMLDRLFGTSFFNPALAEYNYMGAFILDFRSSRSIHSYTPSFRNILRNLRDIFEKRLFGYSSMVFCDCISGFLGFMVWAHHMFTVGLGQLLILFSRSQQWRLRFQLVSKYSTGSLQCGAEVFVYDTNDVGSSFHSIIRNGWSYRGYASICTS